MTGDQSQETHVASFPQGRGQKTEEKRCEQDPGPMPPPCFLLPPRSGQVGRGSSVGRGWGRWAHPSARRPRA